MFVGADIIRPPILQSKIGLQRDYIVKIVPILTGRIISAPTFLNRLNYNLK